MDEKMTFSIPGGKELTRKISGPYND